MKPKVMLYLDHPGCSIESCLGIIHALSPKYDVDIFHQHHINGDSDTFDDSLLIKKDIIKNQISHGKRYLGICMGAYWAGSYYFDILDDVICEQYIKKVDSNVHRPFSSITPVIWEGKNHDMFFYDGCSLIGDNSKFETIATYINGNPMAIIQNNIGLIGCHPESEEYWYDKPYLKKHWHNFIHHKLLLDFVDKLIEH